jgi:hypothetical protein
MMSDADVNTLARRTIGRHLNMWITEMAKEAVKPNPDADGYDNTDFLKHGDEQIKVYTYLRDLVMADD